MREATRSLLAGREPRRAGHRWGHGRAGLAGREPRRAGHRWGHGRAGLAAAVALGCACGVRRTEPISPALDARQVTLARGRAVFMARCERCHPGGEGGLGPDLNGVWAPRFAKRWMVRRGLGAMPATAGGRLGPQEWRDLLAYLKALGRNHPIRRAGRGRPSPRRPLDERAARALERGPGVGRGPSGQ